MLTNKLLAAGLAAGLAWFAPVGAGHTTVESERFAHEFDASLTPLEVAKQAFPKPQQVVIATDNTFADAIIGGNLATKLGGPLLLTGKQTKPEILEYLKSTGAEVTIVGGTEAVSEQTEAQLRAGNKVRRISGRDRYETSRNVIKQAFTSEPKEVYIATGVDFPDALAGVALAGAHQAPLFITNPNRMDAATLNLIKSMHPKTAYVLGGPGTVSVTVEAQLKTVTTDSPQRIAGPDRYETANKIAALFQQREGYVASGENWYESVAAGPLAASQSKPLYLSHFARLPQGIPTDTKLTLVGGLGSLGPNLFISDNVNRKPSPDSPFSLPLADGAGIFNDVGVTYTVTDIEVHGSELCPVTDTQGVKTLMVFPRELQYSISSDGSSFSSGGKTFKKGTTFLDSPGYYYPGGLECGGKHYPRAIQLPTVATW